MPPEFIVISDSEPETDSEPEFEGFIRNPDLSHVHREIFNTQGVVFTGYRARSKPTVPSKRKQPVIVISDDEEPSPKKSKPSPPESTYPGVDREALMCENRVPPPPSKTQAEVEWEREREEEETYVAALSALDLDHEPNWTNNSHLPRLHLDVDDREHVHNEQAASAAAMTIEKMVSERVRRRISGLPKNEFNWRLPLEGKLRPLFQMMPPPEAKRFASPGLSMSRNTSMHPGHIRVTSRRPSPTHLVVRETIHQAPGATMTIVQSSRIIAVASAVDNGDRDDPTGPYNKEGTLFAWFESKGSVLDEQNREEDISEDRENIRPAKHHVTVNDVALDPTSPITFAAAGRDNKVLRWNWDAMGEEWKVVDTVPCKDNPEVIKYQPGSSLLAIQCNDGNVYLSAPGNRQYHFPVASGKRRHVTAAMAWGSGPSEKLLFASSACSEDESGFHKAYDTTKSKIVMEFDANKQACSTLALDPFGERLYIATEGSGRVPVYVLRQYDVRNRSSRKAVQQVQLERFPGSSDRAHTDIQSLSSSPDGIYIAAGRTDNWLDVYDTRMLQRGTLHSFAHEGGDGPDTFGVVKTQWVDGHPFGFGLVSGGVDGCVRLWDTKLASTDPVNGRILAQGDYDVATFSLGDIYKQEVPIIVGERSGKVTLFDFPSRTQ